MGSRRHFRSVLSGPASAAKRPRTATSVASSAFDVIRTARHHSALNQSTRGQVKSQALANERAISKRKQALLTELRDKETHNAFSDRRIGEQAELEGKEGEGGGHEAGERPMVRDAPVLRFARERTRKMSRARSFLLADAADDAHDEQLTHRGQALSSLHFAEYAGEEQEDDRRDSSALASLSFGGGSSSGSARSKKEAMDELIRKSKALRAEKAEEVAVQATRVSSLDADFTSIRAFLDYRSRGDGMQQPPEDDFMQQAHRLAEEARAKAAERARSSEEEAQAERARMEQLERARLRRMRGEEDDQDEQPGTTGSWRKRRREQEKRERRQLQEEGGRTGADQPTQAEAANSVHWADDEQEASEDGAEQAAAVAPDRSKATRPGEEDAGTASVPDVGLTDEASVPFVFPAPTSARHLLSLLSPYSSSLHPLILVRMHAYHFKALTAGNRAAMEAFCSALLVLFHATARQHQPASSSFAALLEQLDAITAILFELAQLIPSHVASAARQLLSSMSSASPSSADLLTSKLLLELFPSSDARHNVVTPLFLHLAAALNFSPLRSPADALRTLFTCQILLHATRESRRFMPEILHALYGMLVAGWSLEQKDGQGQQDAAGLPLLPLYSKQFTEGVQSMWSSMQLDAALMSEVEGSSDGWRVDLQALCLQGDVQDEALLAAPSFLCCLFAFCLRLVTQSSQLYAQLPSYQELFVPFHAALQRIIAGSQPAMPPSLCALLQSTASLLSSSLRAPRAAFALPFPVLSVRLRSPAFVSDYQPGRDYDPVRERAELRELSRKLKREKRGAEKELRKDAQFVRAVEGKDREAAEAAKAEQRRANRKDMEEQARDSNLLHKQTNKSRRKSKSR